MVQTLYEYYYLNYTRCQHDEHFFGTTQGLTYPSHLIQLVGCPIQLLTFWLILKKTPDSMQSMKRPLLISHFCCSLLDTMVCSLVTPFLFLPSIAFLGCGTFTWLGIPHSVQLAVYIVVLFAVYLSILFLFETRNRSIHENRFKIKKASTKVIYYTLNYLICMVSLTPFIKSPEDQESAKVVLLKDNPCPAPEFFSPNVYVWISDEYWRSFTFFVIGPIQLVSCLGNVLFQVGISVYYFYIRPPSGTSNQTRRFQRRFFMGTVIQAGIPTTFIMIPYVMVTVVAASGGITQGMTNSLFITLGLHGVVESVTIILVHRCYRESVWNLIQGNKSSNVFGGGFVILPAVSFDSKFIIRDDDETEGQADETSADDEKGSGIEMTEQDVYH